MNANISPNINRSTITTLAHLIEGGLRTHIDRKVTTGKIVRVWVKVGKDQLPNGAMRDAIRAELINSFPGAKITISPVGLRKCGRDGKAVMA